MGSFLIVLGILGVIVGHPEALTVIGAGIGIKLFCEGGEKKKPN